MGGTYVIEIAEPLYFPEYRNYVSAGVESVASSRATSAESAFKVWFGAVAVLELLIAGLTVQRATYGAESAYGSYLLHHVRVGEIVFFAMAPVLYALSFVPVPFPVPRRFSPGNLRIGAFGILLIVALIGGDTFLDIWEGPVEYQGKVDIGIAVTSGQSSSAMIFNLGGKDFTTEDTHQYSLIRAGRCLQVTYARHADLVTGLRRC